MNRNKTSGILKQVERISSAAAKSGFDLSKLAPVKPDIEEVSDFLEISCEQTVLLCCMIELNLQKTVSLYLLGKHLNCSSLTLINSFSEIEALEQKSYIVRLNKARGRKFTYTDFGYIVPFNVMESLRTSDKTKLRQTLQFNLPNFLGKVHELINSREERSMETAVLLDQIEFMVSNNHSDPFVEFINKNVELSINKCIVFALAYYRFRRETDYSIGSIVQIIFDDLSSQMEYEQHLFTGRNELFRKSIIMFQESQFMNEKDVVLTSKTLKLLYKDFPELYIKSETEDLLISAKTLKKKELYFDAKLRKQIDSITSILMNKNFAGYQKKLESRNLPKGITAIFHGKPGTGKTEMVYQIARKTKRDIMMVDLSQMRSKWFGESEKIVKKLFVDYRLLSDDMIVKPILFINEADGLFSRRMAFSNDSSAITQTVNLIQNIILQELETFSGILFATTNLTVNLDSAFERRFLFKVEFGSPLPEAGQMIWHSRLPELSDGQISILVSKYQLSGGEIENIVRKFIIDNILGSKSLDFKRLVEFCETEKPFGKNNRIGFANNL